MNFTDDVREYFKEKNRVDYELLERIRITHEAEEAFMRKLISKKNE
jgi:hypothetical protein